MQKNYLNQTEHMHFQAKNKEQIIDFHEYYTKDYRYLITSLIKINDDTSTKDMILSLVDSFKIGKIDNETYDLSTVKTEGTRQYREITDDTYIQKQVTRLLIRLPHMTMP